MDIKRLIYLHGLESDSRSGKARFFVQKFLGMLTPDFKGSFEERMNQLYPLLSDETEWTIIGSSFGGLMGAVFTCDHPNQVRKLILLAPALILPPFASRGPKTCFRPYHRQSMGQRMMWCHSDPSARLRKRRSPTLHTMLLMIIIACRKQ